MRLVPRGPNTCMDELNIGKIPYLHAPRTSLPREVCEAAPARNGNWAHNATVTRGGRPWKFEGEAATEKMAFRITPSQRRDLFEVARENRTSATDVLRDAANSYVQDYREQRLFRRR